MSVLCAAVLALSGLAAGGGDAAPRRLGFVVIPDLRATLGRVEQVASVVAPGTLAPGALAAGLGAQLGDPGLAGLGRGPVVLALFSGASPAGPPSVAAFVPAADPEPNAKAMAALGWTVSHAPGLVMGASAKAPPPDPADYRRTSGVAFAGDLRLSLNAVDLMDVYGPVLRSGLDAMAAGLANAPAARTKGTPPPASVAKILQLEVKGLLLLLDQTASVVVDVGLQPDAVLSETVIGPRPGTALAELAAQPPAGANGAAALLSQPAVMTATYQMDASRVSAFAADLVRRAAADPATAALAPPELQSRVALQKNVRRHAGVPVHRFQMKMEAPGLAAEQQAQFALFLRDTELAFARGYLLTAQDPLALDALLDRAAAARAPAPSPLQAARAFGEGAHAYVDYDVLGLLRTVMAAMPATAGAPNPFAALPPTDAHPLLYAAWMADARIRLQSRVPLQPFAALLEAIKRAGADKKVASARPE